MKKKLMTGFLLISILVMTGCGTAEKTLECNKETEQGFMTMVENEKILFKGDNVVEYDEDINITINDLYKDYKDDYIAILKDEFAKFENINGAVFKMEEEGEELVVTLKVDIDKVEDEDLNTLQLARTASYDETLKLRTENGYTCK